MNQQDQQFWEQCAIAAMHGMYSIPNIDFGTKEDVSRIAFEGADAMLTERNKRLEAMKPKEAEWIEWKGGKRPVDKNTRVEIELRNNDTDIDVAGFYVWEHVGYEYDIIAYRVVEE